MRFHGWFDALRLANVADDVQALNVTCFLQLNQKCLKPVRIRTEALGSKTSAIELLKVHALLQILQNAVDDTKIFHDDTSLLFV